MMQIIFNSLLVGAVCGMIGAVYREVLAYEWILNWWFRFGNRFEERWFFKPVWGCGKCFAGQLAGWFWLLFQIVPAIIRHCRQDLSLLHFSIHTMQTAGALLFGLICAICAAIFTASVITKKNIL